MFTAGATWVVDLAPLDRRARVIGLYGLAVWGGLALGPLIGTGLFEAGHFNVVWAFCAISPAIGAVIALLRARPVPAFRGLAPAAADRPASRCDRASLSHGDVGYAAMASFIVLDLNSKHVGHGATAFAAFAFTVVITRLHRRRPAGPPRPGSLCRGRRRGLRRRARADRACALARTGDSSGR